MKFTINLTKYLEIFELLRIRVFRSMVRVLTFGAHNIYLKTKGEGPMSKCGFVLRRCFVWLATEDLEHSALKSNCIILCFCDFHLAVVASDLASIPETCAEFQSECFMHE